MKFNLNTVSKFYSILAFVYLFSVVLIPGAFTRASAGFGCLGIALVGFAIVGLRMRSKDTLQSTDAQTPPAEPTLPPIPPYPPRFNFCHHCSAPTVVKTFDGKEKFACTRCNVVYWNNPKTVSAVVVPSEDRKSVLLVKRGIQPRKGFWALPGGYVETNEGHTEGGIRETREETGLEVVISHLIMEVPLHQKNEVMCFYEGTAIGGAVNTSSETEEVKYFPIDELPEIAFPTHKAAIEAWVAGARADKHPQ